MNDGRYPNDVVNEGIRLVGEGGHPRDVADELRGKYGYDKGRPHWKTVQRWCLQYPMGKQPKSLPPRFKEELKELVQESTPHLESGSPTLEEVEGDSEPSGLSSAEWRSFKLNHPGLVARAIAGYSERKRLRANGIGRSGLMLPRLLYGPEEEAIISAIRRRDSQLTSLEKQFAQAEVDLNRDAATRLAAEISQVLQNAGQI